MSGKRIFRSLLSLLISAGIALPLPALAQQTTQPPMMGLMGTSLLRSDVNDPNVTAKGTIARFKVEGHDVTVTTTAVTPANAEAIADGMVAANPNTTVFAVNDGPDQLHDLIKRKPWYQRLKDAVMPMGRVEETAALQSERVPVSIRQKLVNWFRGEREKRADEWKGVAYSIAIGGVTAGFNYMASGNLSEASQVFGAAFVFAALMTSGEKQWSRYLDGSGKFAKFIATVGGRIKYRDQVEKAIVTTGELAGTMLANVVYATAMQFIDGSANFTSWMGAKESLFAAAAMAYQTNGQVIDSTLHRWRREGILTEQTIKKYMVTPAILMGGGVMDALNLNHVPGITYVSGTIVGAGIAYAYGGPTVEKMIRAYKDFRAKHRGQFFRPHARAASLCASMLGGPTVNARPMAPITFAYSYAR